MRAMMGSAVLVEQYVSSRVPFHILFWSPLTEALRVRSATSTRVLWRHLEIVPTRGAEEEKDLGGEKQLVLNPIAPLATRINAALRAIANTRERFHLFLRVIFVGG